jgi:hypothetical protein
LRSKILILMVVGLVLIGAAVGCGGGGQQGAQSQGGSESDQAKQSPSDKEGEKKASKLESLEGVVTRVLSDKNRMVVRPAEGEAVAFKYRPDNFEVKLDGEEAEPEAIEKGQRATVEYVTSTTKQDREINVARSLTLEDRGSEN